MTKTILITFLRTGNQKLATENQPAVQIRSAKPRQYVPLVSLQSQLFVPAHQIYIELRHSHLGQLFQLLTVGLDRTHQAKAVHYFIGNKLGIVASHLGMMLVIVSGAVLHVGSQRRRQFFGLVPRYQINHMI